MEMTLEDVFLTSIKGIDTAKVLHDGRISIARRDGVILVRPASQDEIDKLAEDVVYPYKDNPLLGTAPGQIVIESRVWPAFTDIGLCAPVPVGNVAVMVARSVEPGIWFMQEIGDGEWSRTACVACTDPLLMNTAALPLVAKAADVADMLAHAVHSRTIDSVRATTANKTRPILVYTSGTQDIYMSLVPAPFADRKVRIRLEDGSEVETSDWSDSDNEWKTIVRRQQMSLASSGLSNPLKKKQKQDVAAQDVTATEQPVQVVEEVLKQDTVDTAIKVPKETVAEKDVQAIQIAVTDVQATQDTVADIEIPEELQPAPQRRSRKRVYKDSVDDALNSAVENLVTEVKPISTTEDYNKAADEIKVLRDLVNRAVSRMANLSAALVNYSKNDDRFDRLVDIIDNMRK